MSTKGLTGPLLVASKQCKITDQQLTLHQKPSSGPPSHQHRSVQSINAKDREAWFILSSQPSNHPCASRIRAEARHGEAPKGLAEQAIALSVCFTPKEGEKPIRQIAVYTPQSRQPFQTLSPALSLSYRTRFVRRFATG